MKTTNTPSVAPSAAPSAAPSVVAGQDVQVQGVRKRMLTAVAMALGIMFGGSCDGCNCNVKVAGKETVGCSYVDTSSRSYERQLKEKEERAAKKAAEKRLEY